jgi:hypothetical protein
MTADDRSSPARQESTPTKSSSTPGRITKNANDAMRRKQQHMLRFHEVPNIGIICEQHRVVGVAVRVRAVGASPASAAFNSTIGVHTKALAVE